MGLLEKLGPFFCPRDGSAWVGIEKIIHKWVLPDKFFNTHHVGAEPNERRKSRPSICLKWRSDSGLCADCAAMIQYQILRT